MPSIDDPELPPRDRRLELAIQIAEHAIRLNDRLLAENAELKRCLERQNGRAHRTRRAKHPA